MVGLVCCILSANTKAAQQSAKRTNRPALPGMDVWHDLKKPLIMTHFHVRNLLLGHILLVATIAFFMLYVLCVAWGTVSPQEAEDQLL